MRRRLIAAAAAIGVLALAGLAVGLMRATGDAVQPRPTAPPPAPGPEPSLPSRPPSPASEGSTATGAEPPPPATAPPPASAAPTPVVPPAVQKQPLLVGVVEDTVKLADRHVVAGRMALLRQAGFRALRMTTLWLPGLTRPTAIEARVLANAVRAARANGIRVYLSVFPARSRETPTTPPRRREFAAFTAALVRGLPWVRDVIVGNEPNLNNFWMPQFDPGGGSASPRDYNALLADTYDAVKSVSPDVRILGGALAPRGGDNPGAIRHTHSPTRFLHEWGLAYRASGRAAPVMDALAFHPYLEYSRLPPEFAHPRTTTISLADYDKLVAALGAAFDGTPQPGSTLPIVYTEFGVQSRIPRRLLDLYLNHGHPAARDAVDRTTQAAYYARAIDLAACQATVEALLLFLALDEPDLSRWQSGVFYVNGAWKPSRIAVGATARRIAAGDVRCGD